MASPIESTSMREHSRNQVWLGIIAKLDICTEVYEELKPVILDKEIKGVLLSKESLTILLICTAAALWEAEYQLDLARQCSNN